MNEAILKQDIEVLAGKRGSPDEAAARIKHLRAILLTVPAQPKASTVSAAPTMDEYNQLLEDVRAMYAGINALRALLR